MIREENIKVGDILIHNEFFPNWDERFRGAIFKVLKKDNAQIIVNIQNIEKYNKIFTTLKNPYAMLFDTLLDHSIGLPCVKFFQEKIKIKDLI